MLGTFFKVFLMPSGGFPRLARTINIYESNRKFLYIKDQENPGDCRRAI